MIRYAEQGDWDALCQLDRHVSRQELVSLIALKRVLVLTEKDELIGWLRYNLFWDNTPFLNMLYILEPYRGMGHGSRLVGHWEAEMAARQYGRVLTSTLSSEQAQFFYRKQGYVDCGALKLPEEPLEILFRKDLPAPKDKRVEWDGDAGLHNRVAEQEE